MAGFRTSEQTPFDIEMRFTMNKLLSCRYNMDTNRVEARFEDGTTLAVSYTHLDVYKRQTQSSYSGREEGVT